MDKRILAIGGLALAGLAVLGWSFVRATRARAELLAAHEARAASLDRARAADPDLADMLLRLERLEDRVDDLANAIAESGERRAADVPATEPPSPATARSATDPPDALAGRRESDIAALQAIALDPRRPTRDRALATADLWQIDRTSGTSGARTPEIVDELIGLLEFEPDAEVRRLICFNTLGATSPAHAVVLVRVLQQDGSEAVRAQAADTLQDRLDDPQVRAALERASTTDASELVRTTAAEMLERWKARER